jgi:Highly conserved protein containing a thioredoxin domain
LDSDEISRLLGTEAGEVFCRIYDVSEQGNFEEKNILHPILTIEQASKYFGKEKSVIETLVAEAKTKLFTEREKRSKPFRDEKIITAWNGLALSGLAAAIKISDDKAFITAATQTSEFIFDKMFRDGFLLHTYKDGQAKLLGYLDDYAFLAVGLLDIYETLLDRRFWTARCNSMRSCCASFGTRTRGVFSIPANHTSNLLAGQNRSLTRRSLGQRDGDPVAAPPLPHHRRG